MANEQQIELALDDGIDDFAELTAEIAALRCALHALTHVVVTNGTGSADAVECFDKLARQWHCSLATVDSDRYTTTAFERQATSIRGQLVIAVQRSGRTLH